jgi:hypothetical protein
MTSPFNRVERQHLARQISSAVTIHGPKAPFPQSFCPG